MSTRPENAGRNTTVGDIRGGRPVTGVSMGEHRASGASLLPGSGGSLERPASFRCKAIKVNGERCRGRGNTSLCNFHRKAVDGDA